MADAKKCDRCGKLVEKIDQDQLVEDKERNFVICIRLHSTWLRESKCGDFEVCNECLKSLLKKYLRLL